MPGERKNKQKNAYKFRKLEFASVTPSQATNRLKFASNSAKIAASSSTSAVPAFDSTMVGKDALKKSQ
jgi:hypothetical protein